MKVIANTNDGQDMNALLAAQAAGEIAHKQLVA